MKDRNAFTSNKPGVLIGAIPLCYPDQLKVYPIQSEHNKYFIINL